MSRGEKPCKKGLGCSQGQGVGRALLSCAASMLLGRAGTSVTEKDPSQAQTRLTGGGGAQAFWTPADAGDLDSALQMVSLWVPVAGAA